MRHPFTGAILVLSVLAALVLAPRAARSQPKPIVVGPGGYPRRALVISVHNYLYANPIGDPRVNGGPTAIDMLTRSLTNGARVPMNQIFRLSDMGKESRPPLKSVIEQGLENFLKTTRKQDRIMVFFIGHTKEIDNEAYLVPLEGEFDDAKTLIPLKWVYDQMAKCECRQKILILDGNRYNAAQGEERPASGPMGPKFEAMLKAPPPGVQVWSACSAAQQSNEAPTGLFLDAVRRGLSPERGQRGALEGIRKPDDLIPLATLNEHVVRTMQKELKQHKFEQAPFISGSPPRRGAAFARSEVSAVAPFLPTGKHTPVTLAQAAVWAWASPRETVGHCVLALWMANSTLAADAEHKAIREILSEISMPLLVGGWGSNGEGPLSFPPFSPNALKSFKGQLKPDAKLRKAVRDARVALWAISLETPPRDLAGDVVAARNKLKFDLSIMRDKYIRPGAAANQEAAFKNRIFEDAKQMSRVVAELEEVLEKLQKAGKERATAPIRWQANYMFVLARVEAQLGYLEEYQSLLGQMRKEFPPHDPTIHNGWRMVRRQKTHDGNKHAAAARDLYTEAASAYRATPWAVLCKRGKLTALGLQWQAE